MTTDNKTLRELAWQLAARTRRDVMSCLAGTAVSRLRGAGIDFHELREYHPEDDARHIHWPSATSFGPVTVKQFHEENELHDLIALDVSSSMTVCTPKWRLATETAALFCAISALFGDGLSLLRFDCRTESHTILPGGQRSLEVAARQILEIPPQPADTDLSALCDCIRNALAKPSRVFIVSDLIGEDYDVTLKRLAFRHDVTVCHILPDILSELPPHVTEVQDAETGERIALHRRSRAEAADSQRQFLDESRTRVHACNASYIHFSDDKSPAETLKIALAKI